MTTKRLIVFAVVIVMNIICFLLMRYDKQCAKQHKRRIPESTLFLSAGLFGAGGGLLGMYLLHHKTKHWNFRAFFPLMLFAQIIILGFAVYKGII